MSLGAIIGGLGSALLGSSGADKAAKAQQQAAEAQIMLEGNIFRSTSRRFRPFLDSGNRAREVLDFELGLGDRPTFGGEAPKIVEFDDTPVAQQEPNALAFPGQDPGSRNAAFGGGAFTQPPAPVTRFRVGDQVFDTRQAAQQYADANKTGGTEFQGFQATPGYEFQLDQGINAIDNSAASRGSLNSGATLKRLNEFGQGLANQEYNNYLNRITGLTQSGQAAAGNLATAGSNFAGGASNALANFGNAGAAGAIGQSNALIGGINNGLGIWNYQNQLANSGNQNSGGIFGGIFGGGSGFNVSPFSSGQVY